MPRPEAAPSAGTGAWAAPAGASSVIELRTRLPAREATPAEARRLVRDVTDRSGRPDLADVAMLLTSELVTNAIRHGGGGCELVVQADGRRLRVEVTDTEGRVPVVSPTRAADESGRGLAIVDALAATWGIEPQANQGKAVWFELV